MKTYKPIIRAYEDEYGKRHIGLFIARGQWANGRLSYSLLDNKGKEVEGEECAYYQVRENHGLIMYRI